MYKLGNVWMHTKHTILKDNKYWKQIIKMKIYALYMFTGDLDKDFLQHVCDVENNSFINVLHTETDDKNETLDQPQIISHSPYYKDENLISTLSENKNKFRILSTNIQSIRAKFDEQKYL